MSTGITPAVHALQQAAIAFRLLEYDYDPCAEEWCLLTGLIAL